MTQVSESKRSDPYVGMELEPVPFVIGEDFLTRYYEGLDLPRPADVTHAPSMAAHEPDTTTTVRTAFANGFGNLWMREEFAFHKPLRVGEEYVGHGRVVDIYPKRDRTVVLSETRVTDAAGELMLVTRHHQSYLPEQRGGGEVGLREPTKKEGARKFEVPAGEPIAPLERTITLEMCGLHFHGSKNYHTDRAASAELGFRDVVVGGRMTMSYAGQLLEDHFGAAWHTSGRMDCKFTNITWPGDTVTAKAVITGPLADEPERTGMFAWLEKPDGTIVLIVQASAVMGS